ncbi:MAG: hypothetical protein ACXADH_12640 [Candidatus Kariarchaeaceae archaeon]|jgi:hypothetical protein
MIGRILYLEIILYLLGALNILLIILTIISILQNGKIIKDDSKLQTIKEITGKEPEGLFVGDLHELSKSQLMKIFLISPAPKLTDMEGEFKAGNFNAGVLSFFVRFFTNKLFGKGKWVGKSFRATEGSDAGEGYNLFEQNDTINRHRRFKLYTDSSKIDKRQSLHLVYFDFNKGFGVRSMHDELRKINDTLYIGMGSTSWGFGFKNPSPFYLQGPATPWVGTNIED